MDSRPPRTIVLVTGLSGAGISSCLKALGDIGFETHDNSRLSFLEMSLREDETELFSAPLAFSFDTRMPHFQASDIISTYERLRENASLNVHLLFLHADQDVLSRRFSETRRTHPLAKDRPIVDGIKQEMELVMPIRAAANIVIDTSDLKAGDLKQRISDLFHDILASTLSMTLMSFGFKHGIPRDADFVFDVRFMSNPHYNDDLKHLRGTDKRVQEFVKTDPDYDGYVADCFNLVTKRLDRFRQEGKAYMTVAVGCTGGHHRSVTMIEDMAQRFSAMGQAVHVVHRDIGR